MRWEAVCIVLTTVRAYVGLERRKAERSAGDMSANVQDAHLPGRRLSNHEKGLSISCRVSCKSNCRTSIQGGIVMSENIPMHASPGM